MKQNLDPRPQSLSIAAKTLRVIVYLLFRFILWFMRVDYKITGTEIVPKKGPAIVVMADHTSLGDAIFLFLSICRSFAGIGMAELKNSDQWPAVIGWAFDKMGHIPIQRGDKESGDLVTAAGFNELNHGQALAVCPQGRQVHPGEQTPWYPGFAKFAMATGTKVYVLKIEGVDKFWVTHPDFDVPKGLGQINWRAKIRAAYVAVVDPADYTSVDDYVAAVIRAHATGHVAN